MALEWPKQAEAGAALLEKITLGLAPQPTANVDSAAETIRTAGNQFFSQWYGPPQFMMGPAGPIPAPRPDVVYLLVGYVGCKAKILNLASAPPLNFAPNLSTTGFMTAGIVPLAVYLLNRLYRRGLDLTIAKDLAAYCILETASQDGKVGGPISMAIATPDRETSILSVDEVAKVVRRAERHRETLRNSFLNATELERPLEPQAIPKETVASSAADK